MPESSSRQPREQRARAIRARVAFQRPLEPGSRLDRIARFDREGGQVEERIDEFTPAPRRAAERLPRSLAVARAEKRHAEIVLDLGVVGVLRQRQAKLLERAALPRVPP